MKVLKNKESELYTVAVEVPHGEDVRAIKQAMFEVMLKNKGCGLAGNQIGVLKRVIAISTSGFTGFIVNPVLSNGRCEKDSKEGCLSVPNKVATVKRFNRVTVEGFDENWKPIKKNLKALSAFCAQHEVDHLNGITI